MTDTDSLPTVQDEAPPPPVIEDPLFFIDYDGTLAAIVEQPMQAQPYPGAPELLRDLNDKYPIWVVTGRHLDDLAVFLPGLRLRAIGLHGAQEGRIGGQAVSHIGPEVQKAIDDMRASAPVGDGITVEAKGPAFAIHYRQAKDKEEAHAELQRWVDRLPAVLDAVWGKKVVEVRGKGVHKGVAVQRVCRAFPDRVPVCLGDDETDEDAFRALHALQMDAVTVRVGGGKTVARHYLKGPQEVVAYLRQYLFE